LGGEAATADYPSGYCASYGMTLVNDHEPSLSIKKAIGQCKHIPAEPQTAPILSNSVAFSALSFLASDLTKRGNDDYVNY
jgi:hypothetical protein